MLDTKDSLTTRARSALQPDASRYVAHAIQVTHLFYDIAMLTPFFSSPHRKRYPFAELFLAKVDSKIYDRGQISQRREQTSHEWRLLRTSSRAHRDDHGRPDGGRSFSAVDQRVGLTDEIQC